MRTLKFPLAIFSGFTILFSTCFADRDFSYDFTWLDPDKEVYVLQNRVYRKKMRVYLQAGGGITGSGPFVDTSLLQGRAGIFLWEDWGIEFLYTQTRNSFNEIAKSVREQGAIPFARQIESYYGALLLWSPFYSKINTFNKIFYMDIIFGLGGVKVEDKNNRKEFSLSNDKNLTPESHAGLIWDVGFRVYLTTHFTIRIDLIGIHYNAEFPNASIVQTNNKKKETRFNNYDYALSFGYVF